MNLDALLDEIADRVADRLIGRLERANAAPVVFTTHKDGPTIPGRSRRWMLEKLKGMPGARKVGKNWEISPADYDAWARAEDARRVKLASAPKVPKLAGLKPGPSNDIATDDPDEAELIVRAERSLKAHGYRRTR